MKRGYASNDLMRNRANGNRRMDGRPHTDAIQTIERSPPSIVDLETRVNRRRVRSVRKLDAEERAQDRVEENPGIIAREKQ
jgi:hypothetical protein